MAKRSDYTARAQRYTARFPVLTYVGTQVNFWIVVNLLLSGIVSLLLHTFGEVFVMPVMVRTGQLLLMAAVLGILYGTSLGTAEYYLGRKFFRKLSLGKIILFRSLISWILVVLLLGLLRFVLLDVLIPETYHIRTLLNERSWNYLFWMLMLYYAFMTLVISFINQVNTKYGPGVLLPLLLGRYRTPKEEARIFMFMDLKSSTTTAEQLGHLKYSAFIRDCFADINAILFSFQAQVYQYVGDEIVVMWPEQEGLEDHACLKFYFACQQQFKSRALYYAESYGLEPHFKAGIHMGFVTAVEIGEVRKDIAYHGDTLNTAARIQSVCNEYHKDFLASDFLLQRLGAHPEFILEPLGKIALRGKSETIGISGVGLLSV